jgi:hypothetical protein
LRKLVTCLALSATSFALVASTAEAAKTSEREGLGKRPPCEKRVDGVLREIGVSAQGLNNVSCRKATRIMKRYILRKKLPGDWECRSIPQLGKCFLFDYNSQGIREIEASFNFTPGQRA